MTARPKVVFASPLPPAKTGIASYSATVLEALERTGFTQSHDIERLWPLPADAEDRVSEADVAVYHLGNNVEFHGGIYSLSVRHPGVVVLHDLGLDGLMYGLGVHRNPLGESASAEALEVAASPEWDQAAWEEPLRVPWCVQAVRRARAVIVHGRFGKRYLEAAGCRTPVYVAPHPLVEREQDIEAALARRDELRAPFHSAGESVLIGVAGDLNAMKGIEQILTALGRIDTPVHLLLIGRITEHWDVVGALRRSGQAGRVTVVEDVPDSDFLAWLCACDVLVNLRHPHRGEASGALLRGLQAGIPSVVSAVGTYLEFPEGVVLHVSAGPPNPEELAGVLGLLANDAGLRRTYGERARAHVLETCSPEATARVYESAIEAVIRGSGGPVADAILRWTDSLVDCGVGPANVRFGHGRRFAAGLDDLLAPGQEPPDRSILLLGRR